MGIRAKLLLPLVMLGVSYAAIMYLYWLPRFEAAEAMELEKNELGTMEVVMVALTPSLLSGDLAHIHVTLDHLLEEKGSWESVRLKSADGNYIYPATPASAAQPENAHHWLTLPAYFDGNLLATLELNIDSDSLIASRLNKIRYLVNTILFVVFIITLSLVILQDRWINRPLKTLVSATTHIARGNFKRALPSASGRDELGRLINSFETMRANLANWEKEANDQHELLRSIQSAQTKFIRDTEVEPLFNKLLLDILAISKSEYGFIGEVLYRDDKPYLRTLAISNIAWNEETRKFYRENAPQGLEFTNLDTLFGAAIKSGECVIANDPAKDPRGRGIPPGHPPLNAFLGLPFRRGAKVIGMIGIANRVAGYDQALIEFLGPITTTCTNIVEALKSNRQRINTEIQLRERETRMRTIFENVVDGIITTNERGEIESFNRAAEIMFGYSPDEVIGRNVSILTPAKHRGQHDRYIREYLSGRESRIMGAGREVEGVRKDGSTLPIDIAVTEMTIGEERLFCSIMRDITERKKVDRMKNEFISTVSHELRTPLTSIRGALGLIGSGASGELPAKAQPLVDIATKNCDRLIRLINDILDIEKIEANRMEFDIKPVMLMEVVNHAVESNRAYASEYGATIEILDDSGDAVILADEDRFTQVLTNLLSNAAKFSPQGGRIGISARPFAAGIRVSVSDEGPGIPDEFRDKVFEKFSQADGSDTRQKGGTGLGLSITRAIVESHGGKISFDTREGAGTTFHVDMPVHTAAVAPAGCRALDG